MMGPTTVAVMTAALAHAALGSATLGTSSARGAVPASPASSAAPAITHDDTPVPGRVSRISVGAAASGAEITIAIDSGVTARHFTLDGPARLVVDLGGASLSIRGAGYDGQVRGPIRNVRLSQFRTDTVRLVIDLDATRQYAVDRTGNEIRIRVEGPAVTVARWESTSSVSAPTSQVAAGRLDSPTPAASTAVAIPETPPVTVAPVAVAAPVVTSDSVTALAEVPSLAEQMRTAVAVSNALKAELLRGDSVRAEAAKIDARREAKAVADSRIVGRAGPSTRQQQQQAAQQPKPRITVSYDAIDIRDVIAAFATFSQRTVVIGKEVSGVVTADINDKPWDVALQAILQAQGLAATEDASGIITIDSYKNLASNQALEPMVTQIVDVNYAKATTLRTTVQALLARDCTGLSTMATGRDLGMPMAQQQGNASGGGPISGQGCVVRGSVAADSATNKLIITEVPSRLPEIIARLAELDIRTPQVAIKAKIIFVNRTGIMDIGLSYDLGLGTKQFFSQLVPRTDPSTLRPIDTNGDNVPDAMGGGTPFTEPARIALGGKAFSGIANANTAIKPDALNVIYSTAIGQYQLTAFLHALQTSSLADVQSEPSVTILNNRTATIFVGQEIPIRVIDAGGQGTSGGIAGGGGGGGAAAAPNAAAFYPRATVSKEEAGIKLTVSPQITNNKMVLLDIQAENSSAEAAGGDVGVIFNRQRADSKVLVADGEAAVIGGLTVTETTRFRSGIPFLMDLPFIGKLFSQNSKNETKRDLLILVTPHILEDGAVPPPGR